MRATSIIVPLLVIICLAVPASLAQNQAGSGKTDIDRAGVPIRLFEAAESDNGEAALRLDRTALRDVATAGGTALVAVPLPGHGDVEVSLRRFSVVDRHTVFVRGGLGGNDEMIDFDPDQVLLLRGEAPGYDGSRAYIAVGEHLVLGSIDLGPGRGRFTLSTNDPAAPSSVSVSGGTGVTFPPLDVDVCGVESDGAPIAPPGGPVGEPQPGIRWLRLAVETDYEYYELFGDEAAAIEYVIVLYGGVSDIYLRDLKIYMTVPFVRIWDTPDDLFNEDNPLTPFRQYWEANMSHVLRETAQLLTGRRNLPYGGVAYVAAICGEYAYSVSGYIHGAFSDPLEPSFGNWDITVCAHELGHSCGSYHTHDYDIDTCAFGTNQRGSVMSYCHTSVGGVANIDLRFHTLVQRVIDTYMLGSCAPLDCNLDGVADGVDAVEFDSNLNGVLDECEDCNDNGILDPVEIDFGLASDVNNNGIPDPCEPDCNGNNLPDQHDIAVGVSQDVYGNGIPDECEADCNGNGVHDYNEIQLEMSLDLDRNIVLDECQDCDDNGVNDFDELDGALNIWATSDTLDELREIHAGTGALVGSSAAFSDVGVGGGGNDVLFSPDGHILVSCVNDNAIAEYDRTTGSFRRWLVPSFSGGLFAPSGMTFGPNGNLFVASRGNHRVVEYDAATGAFIGLFAGEVPDPGDTDIEDPESPFGVAFGPNGNLFVTTGDDKVVEFDGETGDYVRDFVTQGLGGLAEPHGLVFTGDGRLLVASGGSDAILEYDGETGEFLRSIDEGTDGPWCLRIGPSGDRLYAGLHDSPRTIRTYDLESGRLLLSYHVFAIVVNDLTGFDFAPPSLIDCNGNLRPDACDIADGIPVVPCLPPCFADVAGDDGVVNVVDLVAMFGAWETNDPQFDIAPPGGDGIVNVVDMLALFGAWGACQ